MSNIKWSLPVALLLASAVPAIPVFAQEATSPRQRPTTPLDRELLGIVQRGDIEALKPRLEADPELPRKLSGRSYLLHYAVTSRLSSGEARAAMVAFLIKSGANPNLSGPNLVYTPLVDAIKAGDAALVKALLDNKADPNLADLQGMVPLHHAYLGQQPEILRALVEGGVDLGLYNSSGLTPVHLAASQREGDVALLELMLQKGGNPLLLTRSGTELRSHGFRQRGYNALHVAAANDNLAAVKLLLGTGKLDVNAPTEGGETALHLAARGGLSAIAYLLEKGADPKLRNRRGDTPLLALLNPAFSNDEPDPGQSPAKMGALQALLAKSNPSATGVAGLTPLQLAIQARDRDAVNLIAASLGADKLGEEEAVALACVRNDAATLSRLLQQAPHLISLPTSNGWTQLHVAAHWNSAAATARLLELGADVQARDAAEATPLTRALQQENVTPELLALATLLLEKKADVNVSSDTERFASSNNGWKSGVADTPLHRAISANSPELIKLFLKYGARLEQRNRHQQTALLVAARNGRMELIPMLLEAGANVNAVDNVSMSALDRAAVNGDVKTMEVLLLRGANANGGNPDGGMPPLWRAAKAGNLEMTKLLLKYKANPTVLNTFGESVLEAARKSGNAELLQLITAAAGAAPAKG